MKIFSRISIGPISEDNEKIPEEIEKQAEDFVSKYEKYCISHNMKLFEVSMDSIMYKEFKQFHQKYPEYFVDEFETYERRFTKKEMENADFYELEIANIVYVHDDCEEFAMCCENRCFVVSQIEDVFIEPQSFKNKHLGFTTSYRFAISPELKKRCEEEDMLLVKRPSMRFLKNF